MRYSPYANSNTLVSCFTLLTRVSRWIVFKRVSWLTINVLNELASISNTLVPILIVDVIGSVAVKALVLTADTVTFAVAIDKAVARSKSSAVMVAVDVIGSVPVNPLVRTADTDMFALVLIETLANFKLNAVATAVEDIAMDDVPGINPTAETVMLLDAIDKFVARSKSCATVLPST